MDAKERLRAHVRQREAQKQARAASRFFPQAPSPAGAAPATHGEPRRPLASPVPVRPVTQPPPIIGRKTGGAPQPELEAAFRDVVGSLAEDERPSPPDDFDPVGEPMDFADSAAQAEASVSQAQRHVGNARPATGAIQPQRPVYEEVAEDAAPSENVDERASGRPVDLSQPVLPGLTPEAGFRVVADLRSGAPGQKAALPVPPVAALGAASHVQLERTPLQAVPIDEKKAAQTLKGLRLERPELALLCVPTAYRDARTAALRTRDIPDGEPSIMRLTSSGRLRAYDKSGAELSCEPHGSWLEAPHPGYWEKVSRVRIDLTDADGCKVVCNAFSQSLARAIGQPGEHLVSGTLATFGATRVINRAEVLPPMAAGRVYPGYASKGPNTSEDNVRALVTGALLTPGAPQACVQYLEQQTRMSADALLELVQSVPDAPAMETLEEFLVMLHQPESPQQADVLRACARRMSIIGLAHGARERAWRPASERAPIAINGEHVRALAGMLPFALSPEQSLAIDRITGLVQQTTPMNAVLCGEVGSGKTLAFAVPAVAAHMAGARVAIIAPTEILADQLHATLSGFFPMAKLQRVRAGARRVDGDAILIGTSGLTSVLAKKGWAVNLLILDEQHKMSAATRQALVSECTHVLESSATPAPSALASTLYAGSSIITLRAPPAAKQVTSRLDGPSGRAEVSREMRRVVAEGGRVMIVYPRVNDDAKKSVLGVANDLQGAFPGKVAALHGKMADADVERELGAFKDGRRPILVASTIVETGIDVPDVRLVIVREADRFGVAQLHQLRGRIARNGGQGLFAMVTDVEPGELKEETFARLDAVRRINDGFILADEDMKIRGFGDLLQEYQSNADPIALPLRLLSLSVEDIDLELERYEQERSTLTDVLADCPR